MSHPFQMRQMLHTNAKRFIWASFGGSIAATIAMYGMCFLLFKNILEIKNVFLVFYVHPRHLKYEEFFK